LIEVLIYGLLFRAKDESVQLFEGDIDFAHDLELDIDNLLTSVCGFNKKTDIDDVLKIRYQYKFLLESNKQIKEK
jgi:hypothetical protein